MKQRTYATLDTGSGAKTHCKEEAMPWHPVARAATESPHVTPASRRDPQRFSA